MDVRYMGEGPLVCISTQEIPDPQRARVGTRAGSIAIYCAHEAAPIAGSTSRASTRRASASTSAPPSTATWRPKTKSTTFSSSTTTPATTHHHNPRTVANNPAGEITINMGITGPHYTIGAACAAGQCRPHSSSPDATPRGGRLRPRRWRLREYPDLRHLCRIQESRRTRHARRRQ